MSACIKEKYDVSNLCSEKVIAKNALINLIGLVLPFLVGIFTVPMLIKGLGVERFGILTLAWMFIGYFSLFDLGLGRALTQIIASRLGKGNATELSRLVWTALAIMSIVGVVGAAVAGLLSPLLITKVLKMPDQFRLESLHAFYFLAASVPIVILSSGFVGILAAHQRFDLINAVRLPQALSTFLFPLLVLRFSNSIASITLWLALSRLASCIVQYWLCLHIMPLLSTEKRFMPEEIRPLFSFGGWMTISNILSPIMLFLDRFIMGAVISVTSVAYYATPYEMVTKLGIIPGSLVTALFPAFAYTDKSDSGQLIPLLSKSIATTIILIFPPVLVIVTFSRELLMIWLGPAFVNNSAPVLQWLAPGVFINCLALVGFALVQGRGRPDLTGKFHLLELLFYVPLLWWALTKFGITGAAAAWTLRVTLDGIMLLCAAKVLTPLPLKLALKLLIYVIAASVALAVCGYPDSLTARTILFSIICLVLSPVCYVYLRRITILGIFLSSSTC